MQVMSEVVKLLKAELRDKGEYHSNCPFCGKEAKARQVHFSFNEERGGFCFVCAGGGSVAQLYHHLKNEWPQGVESLSPQKKPTPIADVPDKTWIRIHVDLLAEFTDNLWNTEQGQAAHQYLIEEGLPPDFDTQAGWNPESRPTDWGWIPPGIVYPYYRTFVKGETLDNVLYGLRVRAAYVDKDGQPDRLAELTGLKPNTKYDKYLAAPGSKFKMALFGDDSDRELPLVIIEGDKDCEVMLATLEVMCVSTPAGMLLPDWFLDDLRQFTPPWIGVLGDNDEAGQRGLRKKKKQLEGAGLPVIELKLPPEYKDYTQAVKLKFDPSSWLRGHMPDDQQLKDTQTPHETDLEEQLLGYFLWGKTLYLEDAIKRLEAATFFTERHQVLWRNILLLNEDGTGVSLQTVWNRLNEGEREGIGGYGYLTYLREGTTVEAAEEILGMISSIHNAAVRRKVIAEAEKLIHVARDLDGWTTKAVYDKSQILSDTASEYLERGERHTSGELRSEIVDKLQRSIDGDHSGLHKVFQTGYQLDRYVRIRDGLLITIAARPGGGKTAIAINLVYHLATQVPVAFHTLELQEIEVQERILSLESGIPYEILGTDLMTNTEKERVIKAHNRELMLDIYHQPNDGWDSVFKTIVEEQALHGHRIIVIDYLTHVTTSRGKNKRRDYEEYSDMVHDLVAFKNRITQQNPEQGLTIILLNQLNRDIEGRSGSGRMADMSGTDEPNKVGDVVLILRYPYENGEVVEDRLLVDIVKNRKGSGLGKTIGFDYDKACCKITDTKSDTYLTPQGTPL